MEVYLIAAAASSGGDPPGPIRPDPMDEPCCASCGGQLRYRGRRKHLTIWECPDDSCPVSIVEHLDLDTPPWRGGRD
jgi:hypothetical protein